MNIRFAVHRCIITVGTTVGWCWAHIATYICTVCQSGCGCQRRRVRWCLADVYYIRTNTTRQGAPCGLPIFLSPAAPPHNNACPAPTSTTQSSTRFSPTVCQCGYGCQRRRVHWCLTDVYNIRTNTTRQGAPCGLPTFLSPAAPTQNTTSPAPTSATQNSTRPSPTTTPPNPIG